MSDAIMDRATRMAARLRAYEWCCQRNGLPDPNFGSARTDLMVEELHARAWAWAGCHWPMLVGEVEDVEVAFLPEVLGRVGEDMGGDQLPEGGNGRARPPFRL